MTMPMFRILPRVLAVILLASAALSGCAVNPVSGRPDLVMSSEQDEIERARQLHPVILQQFGGAFDDPQLQQYVNDVGQRVAKVSHRPHLQYTFTVIDSNDINAFTTGGGFVYITRGIMAYLNSEAELAAVLGHEIGHVTARHAVRQQTQGTLAGVGAAAVGIFTGSADLANLANYAGTALVRGYGRDMELEADQLGAEYLERVGWDASNMIDVVRLLKNQELFEIEQARRENREPRVYHGVFSTHPDNDTRLREVIESARKVAKAGDKSPPNRDAYLERLAGLPFGSSRAQGVVRDNRFYHADLGFTIAFPTGWNVENTSDRLVAISPGKDSFIQMSTQAPPPNTTPRDFLARLLAQTSSSNAEELNVNGLQGYTAVVRSAKTPVGQGPVRVAVIYYNNLAYLFQAASRSSSGKPTADPLIMSSVKTFRRLKSNEFALAEPRKIKLVRAAQGTQVESLAKSSPFEDYAVERLRLLNDLYPNKEPRPGQYVKVVE